MQADIDYERLYRDAIPAVVSIYVGYGGPGIGAGSGFVYDDHHVLTNEHVVAGQRDVELRFADGQWRVGEVVGTDAYTDLAVVYVEDLPETVTPLPVASANPEPGRPVAALGNPLGLDGSITAGIVSGANRSMHTSNGFAIPDVVQTDAPINPGNSGGPLVALARDSDADAAEHRYEVVGVNRAKSGDNIGFAVSPAIVTRVVPALVTTGEYRHSYLRTRTLDVTPTIAEANGLDEPRGVLVIDVSEGPAGGDALRGCDGSRAIRGREVPVGGDVIVGINGNELRSHEELMRYLITETRPGEPVDVDVVRGGRPRRLTIVLGQRPTPEESRRGPRRRRAPSDGAPDENARDGRRRDQGPRDGDQYGPDRPTEPDRGRDSGRRGHWSGRGTNIPIE